MELDSLYVIVGETGDTDYEDLLMGAHKKLILKEAAEGSSENKLRASGKYQRSDPTPSDGPKILTAESSNFESVLSALQKLGLKIWACSHCSKNQNEGCRVSETYFGL